MDGLRERSEFRCETLVQRKLLFPLKFILLKEVSKGKFMALKILFIIKQYYKLYLSWYQSLEL